MPNKLTAEVDSLFSLLVPKLHLLRSRIGIVAHVKTVIDTWHVDFAIRRMRGGAALTPRWDEYTAKFRRASVDLADETASELAGEIATAMGEISALTG